MAPNIDHLLCGRPKEAAMSDTPPNSAAVLRSDAGLGWEGFAGSGMDGSGIAAAEVGTVH
jgi:hypothetical protein